MFLRKLGLGLMAMICAVSIVLPSVASASEPATLKQGSSSGDVWDLQYRLSQIGIPTQIDGTFGWGTQQSVKKYQATYGLPVDGVVGPQTWRSIYRYTFSKKDATLLARTVYGEARGESYTGQVAVAAVVLNRIHSGQFPNTMSGVIFQKGAFTAVDDGQIWLIPDTKARTAAVDAIRGWDPSRNALYYFNPRTATSKWIWSRPQILRIGNHIFTA